MAMSAQRDALQIPVDGLTLSATIMTPAARIPGVLFVHGWGGSQEQDLRRARGIAALGCICLTFDLRGHASRVEDQKQVSRGDNLSDVVAAYDVLARQPAVDPDAIAVIGSSYGGYLGSLLTDLRLVRWLGLRVPALYRDTQWDDPKAALNRDDLVRYRRERVDVKDNRALEACSRFEGDVLVIKSEHDELIPHQTILSYRNAFQQARSLTFRTISGADHSLSDPDCDQAYTSLLTSWTTEMILGARLSTKPLSA